MASGSLKWLAWKRRLDASWQRYQLHFFRSISRQFSRPTFLLVVLHHANVMKAGIIPRFWWHLVVPSRSSCWHLSHAWCHSPLIIPKHLSDINLSRFVFKGEGERESPARFYSKGAIIHETETSWERRSKGGGKEEKKRNVNDENWGRQTSINRSRRRAAESVKTSPAVSPV